MNKLRVGDSVTRVSFSITYLITIQRLTIKEVTINIRPLEPT